MRELKKQTVVLALVLIILIPTGLFSVPQKTEAIVAVPVVEVNPAFTAFLTAMNAWLIRENLGTTPISIATGALVMERIGPVPGISPAAIAASNLGGQISLKPTTGDFWATSLSRIFLRKITQEIVGWINGGFQGQPAFVRSPDKFLLSVADTVAGDFIAGTELDILCDPFKIDIKGILNYTYSSKFQEEIGCTLSGVLKNVQDFATFTQGNFAQAGWEGWFSINQPQNNSYGSFIAANSALTARIQGRRNIEITQLNWGQGMLSFQECLEPAGASLEDCVKKGPIKTPGQTISSGLSDSLGIGLDEVTMADSIDKIINALANYFITTALSASGLVP